MRRGIFTSAAASLWMALATGTLEGATTAATVSPDKADGFYRTGETIVFTVEATRDGHPLKAGETVLTTLKRDALPPAEARHRYEGRPFEVRVTAEGPSSYILGATPLLEDGTPAMKVPAQGGAVADPDALKSAGGCLPADFDAWWDSQLAALRKNPMNATRTERIPFSNELIASRPWLAKALENTGNYDVRIRMGEGRRDVAGGMSIPSAPGRYPAMVRFYGVGFNGTGAIDPRGAHQNRLIIFQVNAHGLNPGDTWETDYEKYKTAAGPNYPRLGIGKGREAWFYRECFLRAARAVDYIRSMPEWDGQTLIVRGGSQGAAQAIAAAAFDPAVTHCILAIPAMCDFTGSRNTPPRKSAWPLQGNPAPYPEAGYYDAVNFAHRIQAKRVHMIFGLIDGLVPATGPLSFYNALPKTVEKSCIPLPTSGHSGETTFPYEETELRSILKQARSNP